MTALDRNVDRVLGPLALLSLAQGMIVDQVPSLLELH
jgi:hypothetical protein